MFARLFKHEFLGTWRMLAIVVGAVFLVGLTLLVPALFDVPVMGPTGLTLSAICFIGGGAVVPILLAVQYWRTMYSGPGYFTHAVPVRGRVIFAAKTVYAVLASVVGLVVGIGLAILLPGMVAASTNSFQLSRVWDALTSVMSPGQVWLFLASVLISYCAELVLYLSAISIGTRGAFNGLGLGGPVIAVIIAYLVNQIVAAISLFAIPLSLHLSGSKIGTITMRWMGLGIFTNNSTPELLGVGWFPMSIVVAVVAAIVAIRSIERHTCLR